MQAIRNVFAAFGNLASSVNALAGVIDAASGKLRQQLALDGAEVIEHRPAEGLAAEEAPARKGKGKATP